MLFWAGEVTSKVDFTLDDYTKIVRAAVNDIGYTKYYQGYWGEENTICGDELNVISFISQQSPDISQGVENNRLGRSRNFLGDGRK